MNNHLFSKSTILAVGAFSILLCYSLPRAETTGSVSVNQLRQWSEKLDSLEVEKQAKKRNGLPLAELETKTASLRDSIKTIRLELGQTAAPQAAAAPRQKGSIHDYLIKILPGGENKVFDRILLFAGVIATFTGLFFLFILLALKSRRRKQTRNQTKRVAAQYEEVQRKVAPAQSAFPDSFATTPSESAALASAIPPAPTRRMPAEPSDADRDRDLKDLVLKAGSEGLDAKEISRRYHISIDQVALMLKMAKKQ